MRNSYSSLKVKLFLNLLKKRKISLRKLFNTWCCIWSYFIKSPRSGKFPFVLSLELGNQCNIACRFCRNEHGQIHNANPQRPDIIIEKGEMPLEIVCDLISQMKDDLLIAVLYTNGEPLMYRNLPEVIKFATRHRVATMIATNGHLLTEKTALAILESGIDFIKIQMSGFTQDIYTIETRFGNVEKLKENIRNLVSLKKKGHFSTIILLDYIQYQYNQHQIKLAQDFCDELNMMMNVRPGNPFGGLEKQEKPLHPDALPLPCSCPWLWQGMQIHWNGDIHACCDATVWGGAIPYEKYQIGKTDIRDTWNSKPAQQMRQALSKKMGRADIPMCAVCTREGIAFKW